MFRNSKQKLDFALEQLKQLRHEGKPFTTPALNVIMSGAAESGDIDRILSLLQEYSRNSIEADSDTFSFCFESLGKNLLRTERNPRTDDHVNACLIAADSFLTMMDEKDIVPNSHIIRNYVELLCQVDQIETATAIVLEASSDLGLVCSKTIYRAAMANAKLRQFDVARKVATCVSGENLPFLLQSIDREEDQLVTPNEIKLTEERNRLQTLQRDSERNNARPQIDSQMPSFWRAYAGNDNLDDTCLANEDRFERRRDLLDSFVE